MPFYDPNAPYTSPSLEGEFLRRLWRLLRVRRDFWEELSPEVGQRLVDRSIYSTYRDLCNLGLYEEAVRLLRNRALTEKPSANRQERAGFGPNSPG